MSSINLVLVLYEYILACEVVYDNLDKLNGLLSNLKKSLLYFDVNPNEPKVKISKSVVAINASIFS
jgi:hypothetical protein